VNLPFVIADHRSNWTFRDSDLLEAWLMSRPWNDSGGVKLLRVAASSTVAETALNLRRAISFHNDASSSVQTVMINRSLTSQPFQNAVQIALELNVEQSNREFRKDLTDRCGQQPLILLAQVGENGLCNGFLDAAVQYVELIAKGASPCPLTIVVIGHGINQSIGEGDVFDFTVGMPNGGILDRYSQGEDEVWRRYVHQRVAWEVAGNPAMGSELGDLAREVKRDDDELETVFNNAALDRFRDLSAINLQQIQGSITQILNGSETHGPALWIPIGQRKAQLIPWMARAILLQDRNHYAQDLLRAALVCTPLVRELLGRCLVHETTIRTERCHATTSAYDPSFENAVHDKIQKIRDGSVRYYPTNHPSIPRRSWSFLEFGHFLKEVYSGKTQQISNTFHVVREVRNVLAHGHHASWETVKDLMFCEQI
jgi:hypothetical protein